MFSILQERDDLLQRLENDGSLEINDLKTFTQTIRLDKWELEGRETVLAAKS